MTEKIITDYYEAVFDTDRDKAVRIVREAVAGGLAPEEAVFGVIIPVLDRMMLAISEGQDANLAQHFMTSQIAVELVDWLVPQFKKKPAAEGRVVIGTAEGDLHSLGKRIVSGCLRAMMMEVFDLGANVPPERFVDAAVEHDAQVIGISAMMAHTARGENGCLGVRRLLKERGLEGRFRIVVGGAPYQFDPELYKAVGADAWSPDGVTAGKVISGLVREVRV